MYGGSYDKLLYEHLSNYYIFIHYKFANLVLQSIPFFFEFVIKVTILPFVFLFKIIAFYLLLFYFFNLNDYFYRLYFMVSYVLSFLYPKMLQLQMFLRFLNIISYQEDEKEKIKINNQRMQKQKKNTKTKTDKERFIEIIQKELKYPDALFPVFLYYIVYKRTIFHDMLIDVCIFCFNAFFRYNKQKTLRKNNSFIYVVTQESDLLFLFFIFNILLLIAIFSVPLIFIKNFVNIFCYIFKLLKFDTFISMQLRFLKNKIPYNNRMIQFHLLGAAQSGVYDNKNINIKKIVHTIYTYMNPFRRLNETIKLYVLGFIHMEEFYRNVLKEVQKN